jgi:hypothetical protein
MGLLLDMFRHGLAHTHLTKSVRLRNAKGTWITLTWGLNDNPGDVHRHLSIQRVERSRFRLWFHVPTFAAHTLAAIDLYCDDLIQPGEGAKLLQRFKAGYLGTAAVSLAPDAYKPKGKGKGKKQKEDRLLPMANYSLNGINWIRGEIDTPGHTWRQPTTK